MVYHFGIMSTEGRRERISPSFKDSKDLEDEWQRNRGDRGSGTYARAGYEELRAREKEIAEMLGVPDAALFNAGMAAIATVLEAENLHPGSVVLCGKDMYGKTRTLAESLEGKGVRVVPIDSGDMAEIARAIDTERPRLIILEAVANAATMQVCDVRKLAELAEQANARYRTECTAASLLEKYLATREYAAHASPELKEGILEKIEEFKEGSNPMIFRDVVRTIEEALGLSRAEAVRETARLVKFVLKEERDSLALVLDNTLSSPVLRNPLNEVGERDVTAIVVESGTKHFQEGKDQVTLGVVYTNSGAELARIKAKRAEMGTYLQPHDEALLPEQLAAKMSETVKRQAAHALVLATLLEGTSGVDDVSHPNLSSHRDTELAQMLAPDGLVTLFYIKVADPTDFVDRIKEVAGDAIEIGSSFGHEKTRLLPMSQRGEVRIAAGAEDEASFARLVDSLKTALNT